MVVQVANDPAGYLGNIKELAGSLASDPALLGQLVSSLPQAVIDEQELANPYSEDSELHATFAAGWYSGYIAGQLFMMWAGGEAVKSITSSEQFAQLSNSLASKMDKVKAFMRASSRVDSFALFLADDSGSLGLGDFVDIFAKMKTLGKKASFERTLEVLQGRGISDDVIRGYLSDVSKIKDIKGSDKFVTKLIQDDSVGNFKSLSWEADRAAYYRGIASDMEIEPIKQIDLRVGNKFIEMKASNGPITESNIRNYLDDAQEKFASKPARDLIGTNPTKLEISAKEGFGSVDENIIGTTINDYMKSAFVGQTGPQSNLIDTVEVFLPGDVGGGSLLGTRNPATGLFDWTRVSG